MNIQWVKDKTTRRQLSFTVRALIKDEVILKYITCLKYDHLRLLIKLFWHFFVCRESDYPSESRAVTNGVKHVGQSQEPLIERPLHIRTLPLIVARTNIFNKKNLQYATKFGTNYATQHVWFEDILIKW